MTRIDDVVFCGAWDEGPGYPRTTVLRQALRQAGVVVREVRAPGLGTGKQQLLRQPWRWPLFWWRQQALRRRLVARLRAAVAERRPGCVVVPYPGHALVAALRAAVDVPVVLDLFLSAYDTIVEDRQLVLPGSLAARWLQRLDTRACAAADLVLVDTPANAAYLATLTGLAPARFAWLPVGVPEQDGPLPRRAAPASAPLQVLFFGTGVPLHGLTTLIDAVAAVPDVQLTLVGGTEVERARATTLLGNRLTLEPKFVDAARLRALLAESDVVAGVFGGSGKAQRVVPYKLVHALAAGRPVLTADTPAVAGWLDGSGAVFVVPAGDVRATANCLGELAAAPAVVAAAAGHARAAFERCFALPALAARWRSLLDRLAGDGWREAA